MINAIVLNTNIAATTDRPTTTPVLELSLLKKKSRKKINTNTSIRKGKKATKECDTGSKLNSVKRIFPILPILNDWCHVLLDWVLFYTMLIWDLKIEQFFWLMKISCVSFRFFLMTVSYLCTSTKDIGI